MSPLLSSPRSIAVLFGGNSPEHDVSIITALQVMDAFDPRHYHIVPIYCDFDGGYLTGPGLRQRENYRPKPTGVRGDFAWTDFGPGLVCHDGNTKHFDCVVMCYHGLYGEDGREQAHLERLGIPYTGFNSLNSALAMRKDITKEFLTPTEIPMLPHAVFNRPVGQAVPTKEDIEETLGNLGFPLILKPCSLGSSIGVALAKNMTDVEAVLPSILAKDRLVMAEPQVRNLCEYNIAIRMGPNGPETSAIEQPKTNATLLDFKEKYLSGGGKKGTRLPSEGMLSLTRDINPTLEATLEAQIHDIAIRAFVRLGGRGAPRFDFLHDQISGALYLNEVNPIPGSFAHFLWEARKKDPVLFPDLLHSLVQEALADTLRDFGDPVPGDARLLKR